MSLRTIQRLTMMSVLALAAVGASGCTDDETTDDAGSTGGQDAGNNGTPTGGTNMTDDGGTTGGDAGTDGGDDALMCGMPAETCEDGAPILGALQLPACCADAEGEEVCGVNGDLIPMLDSLHGCQVRDLPGTDDADTCDMVLYGVNRGVMMPGGMPTQPGVAAAPGVFLNFVGCCLPTGTCGVNTNDLKVVDMEAAVTGSIDLSMGCVPFKQFASLVPDTVPADRNPFNALYPCGAQPDAGTDSGM